MSQESYPGVKAVPGPATQAFIPGKGTVPHIFQNYYYRRVLGQAPQTFYLIGLIGFTQ
jgi:hypothetical protein